MAAIRTSTQPQGPLLLAGLLSCLAGGAVVAAGRATLALALLATTALTAVTILNRRRAAPLLWAGVAFTAPLQGIRVAPSLAVSDVLIVAAFLTILPDGLLGWRRIVPGGVVVAFGLLITAGLAGTFFAPDVGASLSNLVKVVLAAAGSVVAMALWDPGSARLRRFAWLWFAGATASAAWAALTPRTFAGRAIGFTTHANHLGMVCQLAIGLGIGLALSSTGRARTAAFSGVLVLTVGVGLSGSRSALLGTVVTIGVASLLARRFRLLVAIGVVTTLAAMGLIVGLFHLPETNAIARLGGSGGSGASDLAREEVRLEAFASIARRPFTGEGFEFAQAAHNIYLQALVVGGPLALLSFLVVSGLIIRAGLRALRIGTHRAVLAGLTAGYVGYLASGTVINILWDRYLWTYIGLLLVLARSPQPPPPTGARSAPDIAAGQGDPRLEPAALDLRQR